MGEGVSGWVAANRQVIMNSEASLDLGEQAHSGVRSKHALSVPLITRESLVGTVTLYSRDDLHREPEPARAGHRAAPRAGDLDGEAHRQRGAWLARTECTGVGRDESRHASRVDALRHSRSARQRRPTLVSISRIDIFRPSADFFVNSHDSSVGVYLALRFSDRIRLRAGHRRFGGTREERSCGSSHGWVSRWCYRCCSAVSSPPNEQQCGRFQLPANVELLHDIEPRSSASTIGRRPFARSSSASPSATICASRVRIDPSIPSRCRAFTIVQRRGRDSGRCTSAAEHDHSSWSHTSSNTSRADHAELTCARVRAYPRAD